MPNDSVPYRILKCKLSKKIDKEGDLNFCPAWAFIPEGGPTVRLSRAADGTMIERDRHVKE